MNCNRCDGTGFLNLHQVPDNVLELFDETGEHDTILQWIDENDSDVQVCDCCGDGGGWYGEPGEHDPDNEVEMNACDGIINCW